MYFDDDAPFRVVQRLCSLFCAVCASDTAAPPQPPFPTLAALQSHLRNTHKQHMCGICLQGRNVFISQQILYSRVRHHP